MTTIMMYVERQARLAGAPWNHPAEDVEIELEVEGSVAPYCPGRRYLSNGDPGSPPEGGEAEDVQVASAHVLTLGCQELDGRALLGGLTLAEAARAAEALEEAAADEADGDLDAEYDMRRDEGL